ncbi:AP-1 complex subunit mu-2 [Pycnococcus provasolii]|uniref:AP-1 complex subunit mu-2 n=1 Tax=Pycnococcus provasolii TaxID=41880 RepID=A0A830I0R4_9CHLO|nr:AP-1 complex subunit mu-2 [Pycnococcus provasolii]
MANTPSAETKAQLKELSTLAGVPLRDDVFDALVELTYLDIVPTAISQVVASLCKKANAVARSPVFVLDAKGKPIISRDFRGEVAYSCVERFNMRVAEMESENIPVPPIFLEEEVSFCHISHNNVVLLAVCSDNSNAMSVLLFLHKLVDVFKHYFEELEEESIRDNFVIVYELLDEVMDHGYPQYTEARILSEFIKTDAHKMEVVAKPPMAVTNAVSWRSEGIKYAKNDAFLDVVESVNLTVNSSGSVVRSEVNGALKMRTYLSGMPECKLGLNDKVLFDAQGRGGGSGKNKAIDLDDIKFHQCVRLSRFENDRTISFIPPDGAFDLMTYRLTTQVKPLIWVEVKVERHSRTRIEYLVKARSQFKDRSTARNVEILLPVPPDATTPAVRTTNGNATYAPEKEALIWKINSFPGGKEFLLRCKYGLPSVSASDEDGVPAARKPPVQVKFEIPYFTVSGIQVRYLKVIEKSGYTALPWVRYITVAGNYEIRFQ